MLVFRSFAIGLSAACFALLVMRPTVELRLAEAPPLSTDDPQLVDAPASRRAPLAARPASPPLPTIVDAAPGITPTQLALTIRLQAGEQIASVDDIAVTNDLSAGILLASRDLRAGQFIDLGVAGPDGERRILILLH